MYNMAFREFKYLKYSSTVLDLRPLLTIIKTIAISSSECKRAFSSMNIIVSTKINALNPKSISSLMLINCVRSLVHIFVPEPLLHHGYRRTNDELMKLTALSDKITKTCHSYVELWNVLKI
jgi:type III secretory pathway component EscR